MLQRKQLRDASPGSFCVVKTSILEKMRLKEDYCHYVNTYELNTYRKVKLKSNIAVASLLYVIGVNRMSKNLVNVIPVLFDKDNYYATLMGSNMTSVFTIDQNSLEISYKNAVDMEKKYGENHFHRFSQQLNETHNLYSRNIPINL
jgi:hypothetical protein